MRNEKSGALEQCQVHRPPHYPRFLRCCAAQAMSYLGQSETSNHVRDEGSFPPKRSLGAGDGCTALTALAIDGGTCSDCGHWCRRPWHLQWASCGHAAGLALGGNGPQQEFNCAAVGGVRCVVAPESSFSIQRVEAQSCGFSVANFCIWPQAP